MQLCTRDFSTVCLLLVLATAVIPPGLSQPVEPLAASHAGLYISGSWVKVTEPSSTGSALEGIAIDFVPEEANGVLFCCVDRNTSSADAEVLCVYLSGPKLVLHFSSPPLWLLKEQELNYSLSAGRARVSLTFSATDATLQVGGKSVMLPYTLPRGAAFYLGGIPDAYLSPVGFVSNYRNRLFRGNIHGCVSAPTFKYANGLAVKGEPSVATSAMQSAYPSRCLLQSECSPLDPYSCQHNGLCIRTLLEQSWRCDCRRTNFTGPQCQNEALMVPLYLRQGFILQYDPPDEPLAFDVTLHFRSEGDSGLIFCLVDSQNGYRVELRLERNHLLLEVGNYDRKFLSPLYSIAPEWRVRLQTWYFVHVFSDRHYLTLQLDDLFVSIEAPLSSGVFASSQFAVGDNVDGNAETIFEGCLRNLHTGLHKATDVSLFNTTTCSLKDILEPPPTPKPVRVFYPQLSYVIDQPFNIQRLQFLLTTRDQEGVVVTGFHDKVLSFTLFLSPTEGLCLEWINLLRERIRTCDDAVPNASTNITIEAEAIQYSFRVGDGPVNRSPPSTFLRNVNRLVFGGVPTSVSGSVNRLLVDGAAPATVWILWGEHITAPDATTSSGLPSPFTTTPTTQHLSSSYNSPLSSSSYVSHSPSSSYVSHSSFSSNTFPTSTAALQSTGMSSVEIQPTSTSSAWLSSSTAVPVPTTQSVTPTHNSEDIAKVANIILVTLVSTLCVALLFVVVVVLIFFTRHCCQFFSNQTCDSHHYTAKASLSEIEKNDKKEYV